MYLVIKQLKLNKKNKNSSNKTNCKGCQYIKCIFLYPIATFPIIRISTSKFIMIVYRTTAYQLSVLFNKFGKYMIEGLYF